MFGQVINRVAQIVDFGHKYCKSFGKQVAQIPPTQFF